MSESHYPTVDIETMNQFVIATGRLEKDGIDVTGEVVKYILAGPQAIYKGIKSNFRRHIELTNNFQSGFFFLYQLVFFYCRHKISFTVKKYLRSGSIQFLCFLLQY